MSTHGIHAGCIEDMWQVAIEIVKRAGGDRGFPGLAGPAAPPEPVRPARLMVLETEGWAELDEAARHVFSVLLERLERAATAITAWENRWAIRNLVDEHPDGVSERAKAGLARAEAMTVDDYRALLLRRAQAQAAHAAAAPLADAAITLSCPGPAPPWSGDVPGEPLAPRPTGDAVFNTGSSMLFAPCVSMPLMSVGGLPVGAQVIGLPGEDAHMTAIARWSLANVEPVTG